ncbi:MAG: hypothetical protein QXQ40_01725 [Candidatus Aenigmatarchaeota archaeon]
MKNHDKIILVGILSTIMLVSINHIQMSIANDAVNVSDNNLESYNITQNEQEEVGLIVLEKNTTYETRTHITRNGFELEIGTVHNLGEDRKIEVNILNGDGHWIVFRPYIRQNQTWNYGKIGNMIILPKESGLIINPFNTSYYKTNKQLRIGLDGYGSELFVYVDKRPTRVSSNINVHWTYDKDTKLLSLRLDKVSDIITIDWTEYPLYGTLFIEDQTKKEELDYYLKNLKESYKRMEEEDSLLLHKIGRIGSEIASINASIQEKKSEKSELEKYVNEINRTKEELSNKLMGSTLISPIKLILIVVWMVVLISYIFVFQMEKIKVIRSEK